MTNRLKTGIRNADRKPGPCTIISGPFTPHDGGTRGGAMTGRPAAQIESVRLGKAYRAGRDAGADVKVGDAFLGAMGAADAMGYGAPAPTMYRRVFMVGYVEAAPQVWTDAAGIVTRTGE